MLLPCKLGRLIEFSSLSVVKDEEEVESQVGVEPEPQVDSALKPVDESLLDQLVECEESNYIKTWTKEERQSQEIERELQRGLVNLGEVELNNNITDHFAMQDTTISSQTEPDKTSDGSVENNAKTVGNNEESCEDDLCDKK